MQRGNRILLAGGLAIMGVGVGVGVTPAAGAPVQATIDFESGLGPGAIVSTLEAGVGISGADAGTVSVFGQRSDLPGVNQAMIFDATCGGDAATCSGDDSDLFQPQLGNVLIISESGDASDPDDADVGERIEFDFSAWGTGVVTVVSLDVLDVEIDESPGQIEIGSTTVPIPNIGDGNVQTVAVGGSGSVLAVVLNGSGAIDNIAIEFEPAATTTTTPTSTTSTSTTSTSTPPAAPPTTSEPPGSTTSSTVVVLPPSAPTTPTGPRPRVPQLPATGAGTPPMAIVAAGLFALGLGLVTLARRTSPRA